MSKKKDLIDKELKRKYDFFEILWYAYGILFGPIEIAIMYFLSNGFGLFKAAFYLLIVSFVLMIIPLVLRLIFKLFRKEIFYYDTIEEMISLAIASVVISWGVFTLIDSWKEGAGSAIFLTIFLDIGIVGVHSIPYFITKLFYNPILDKINPNLKNYKSYSYGDSSPAYDSYSYSSSSDKNTKSEVDKKREEQKRKEKEYYDKNFKVTHKQEDVYDQWGNFIGTRETTSVGDWVKNKTFKDKFGNEVDEHTTYYHKY